MKRLLNLVGLAVISAGLVACAASTEVTSYPDLRVPQAPAPAALTEGERDAAIADLQEAAASNARLAK